MWECQIRRFVAPRGMPARLITGNYAKTFMNASKEAQKILRSIEIEREMTSEGMKWVFIIEKAPWQGGFYERIIQSTKRCLKKILGRACMNFESRRTLLVEIETAINNRPLTYVYDNEERISYPLTPSRLVYGRQISLTPSDRQFDIIKTNQALTNIRERKFSVVYYNNSQNDAEMNIYYVFARVLGYCMMQTIRLATLLG